MEMFVQVSENRIIPTRNIVDISVFPATEEGRDEELGEWIYARPLRVDIVTNATTSAFDDGGDYPGNAHTAIAPYTIILRGEEAQVFLDALPTYTPVAEPAREEAGSTNAQDIVLEEEERRIKRVLKEAGIADMSDRAWDVVWSFAVWDVHPTRTSGQLSQDELRTAAEALIALGLWDFKCSAVWEW
jgi:hypothetical protein